MAEVKTRIQKWDILKFILIFFVVFGHICEQYSGMSGVLFFIYSFHMPLFVFISGLFSKKTINEKRYDKIFTYFVLYILIKIILFFSRVINKDVFYFRLFEENGVPWYAFAVFVFCLITILVKNTAPIYVLAFSVILACFAGYDSTLSNFLVVSRIIVFYPFFYAGYVLEPDFVAKKLSSKPVKIVSAVIIIGFIVFLNLKLGNISFLRPLLSGKNPYSTLERYADLGGLWRLGYYAFAFVISAAIIALIPDRLGKGTIAKLGGRSVQVYALHYFFIDLLYSNFNLIEWADGIYPNLSRLLIVPVSFAILLLCSTKYLEPIFKVILNPKKLIH